jgi:hypothetical protein
MGGRFYYMGLLKPDFRPAFRLTLQERLFKPLGTLDTGFWLPREKLHLPVSLYSINAESQLTRVEAAKTCRTAGLGGRVYAFFGGFLPLLAILVARVRFELTSKGL